MSEPIVTTTDLDAYLSGDQQAALDAATAAVRAYCGWHVTPEVTETVTADVHGMGIATLPSLHVTDVTEVRAGVEVVDAAGYEWSAAGILRVHAKRGFRTLEVTVTHGHEADSTAGTLLSSIILATAARTIASPSGLMRAQVGQVSETYSQTATNQAGGVALLDSERALLAPYKLPPRP